MPLIRKGSPAENDWVFLSDGVDAGAVPASGGVTVTLGQFKGARDLLSHTNTPLGVRLTPEDDPEALEPFLESLPLIEISFPKYTDGRGYSQAQLLRRRFQYPGELRAVGHVLRDQIFYLMRSGFDAFDVSSSDVNAIVKALSDYTEAYQLAAAGPEPVFLKRQNAPKV
jgi:uncharacterized protein (DUF934 family)